MAPLEPNPPDPCLHAPFFTHWSPICSSQTEYSNRPSEHDAHKFRNKHSFRVIGTRFGCSTDNWGYCSNSYVHLDGRWIKLNSSIDSVTSRYENYLRLYCFDKGVGGIMSECWMIIIVAPFQVEQHNGSHSSYVINLPFILCQETCKGMIHIKVAAKLPNGIW
ncbi:hypothetical protein Cgig2_016055 [Carnegiea gigantea]|uniref:Uncharacterized protein n=1 Tax=Carnegiea gigantea TaxID=171969 RepID=A0A9Q1JWL3_9CARY|nr:hypothetical protein Cgig2_016055 [Carnegiea gigantea]